MTTQEFSNAFDTLLNSFNSKTNFGEGAAKNDIVLDEYEKSVFLTQAQDIIVKSYFSNNTNNQGEGLDDSARRQIDFSKLITVGLGTPIEVSKEGDLISFDDRGLMYQMPSNVLVVLNERLVVSSSNNSKSYVVIPISYSEYDRIMSKAYAQPLKKQCWRLFNGETGDSSTNTDINAEIIPIEGAIDNDSSVIYKVRYIKRPAPIILTNLTFTGQESLDIDGKSNVSECELNPIIHMDILNKAFELAIISKTGSLPKQEN